MVYLKDLAMTYERGLFSLLTLVVNTILKPSLQILVTKITNDAKHVHVFKPSETYKMKLIILAISPILDIREETAQTFDMPLSHLSIYLLIYSYVSDSPSLN